ncbi:helix-turn-helix domain-containing protein [Amycolatopsis rhabdoformis]|uniref:Helix-turn-helix domain-containing protein n=1 Tax=Amycolatopsis rhabdoformis TaxID=1448059 RepID=A0ABZ1HYI3_9PSEU|nr:helix-turn-helix domain-containing protein [Amycolatopsis rhabdoformis]WSE27239.1 helix-turn-helix domain-containing protein [Amycolatopsis rhabdoformis]
MPARLPQTLRSDARDNRDRILTAAREVFAAEGLDVPMREVARRAGVGPATLYRHFPTKEDLAGAAFADQLPLCQEIVAEGLATPDPWLGFRLVIEKLFDVHARDRGFTAAFLSRFPRAFDFTAARDATLAAISELALRAKTTGHLRPDFVVDDLVLVLMANNGIQASSPEVRVAASRRFAALAIQAFRATPEAAPLPPAARMHLRAVV